MCGSKLRIEDGGAYPSIRRAIIVASSNGSAPPRNVRTVVSTRSSVIPIPVSCSHGEERLQPLGAEHLARLVLGLDEAVGVEEQQVARPSRERPLPDTVPGIERDRHAGRRQRLEAAAGAEDELRIVAGVDVAQLCPAGVEDAEEQRQVDGARRVSSISRSRPSASAARSDSCGSRARSVAWTLAISSAALTPLPETSPTSRASRPSGSAK